ncbi:MAG: glycosyltransferase family 1 protein [Syntrophobacteraceae bacterium]|nr:glycosyltransferase family 1 protein [Syntrophobacteraceae bacterium]
MKGRLPTGVDRVCLAYIRQYRSRARVFVQAGRLGGVFSPDASQKLFDLLMSPGEDFFRRATRIMALSPPLPWFGRSSGRGGFLLNIGHSGLDSSFYSNRQAGGRGARPIFMVHDLIPFSHPEFSREGEDLRHVARMATVLRTAAGVVTNSSFTLEVLKDFARARGAAMPPAVVAPLASGLPRCRQPIAETGAAGPGTSWPGSPAGRTQTDNLGRAASKAPLDHPCFVMVGTIEPRKNHWMILQVWRRIVERLGRAAPGLVIIGQRGWECENVIDILERGATLSDFVHEASGCSDEELVWRLRRARALIFPSFIEGYGLPLIEALSNGVPVIASNLPVFREIAGDIPDYLDPLDGIGWLERIVEYCRPESARRAAQMQRLSGFTPPSWQAHFEAVETLLDRIG